MLPAPAKQIYVYVDKRLIDIVGLCWRCCASKGSLVRSDVPLSRKGANVSQAGSATPLLLANTIIPGANLMPLSTSGPGFEDSRMLDIPETYAVLFFLVPETVRCYVFNIHIKAHFSAYETYKVKPRI